MQMMDMRYENHVIEIKDFLDPALDVYARLNEVQLLNRQDLSQGMFLSLIHISASVSPHPMTTSFPLTWARCR